MTITIGIAINQKTFILSYRRIKSAKPSILARLKSAISDLLAMPIVPLRSYGVA